MSQEHDRVGPIEGAIAAALDAGDLERAASLTLRHYGPEILGFLMAQLRSDQHAEDVFSMFAEDLWRGLGKLTLRSSMRAYAYCLARNASHRFLARELRKKRAQVNIEEHISKLVEQVRTETAIYLATDSKHKLSQLRDRLSADEQALLTLRIDRGLAWAEIAEIFGEGDEPRRAAARYRKRFQQLKQKLADWMREAGLLELE